MNLQRQAEYPRVPAMYPEPRNERSRQYASPIPAASLPLAPSPTRFEAQQVYSEPYERPPPGSPKVAKPDTWSSEHDRKLSSSDLRFTLPDRSWTGDTYQSQPRYGN